MIVVGGGIVGLACARNAALKGHSVTVLEKEIRLAAHQSSHNSGVIHTGAYYQPGSLKARLCVQGAIKMLTYCEDNRIPLRKSGKLVVSRNEQENEVLNQFFERAEMNGVPVVEWLDSNEAIRRLEPGCTGGIKAVHLPTAAITNYELVAKQMANDILDLGGRIILGFQVTKLSEVNGAVQVTDQHGKCLDADRVLTCAGLQSDRLAILSGYGKYPAIIPFSGRYDPVKRSDLVKKMIYPVPNKSLPFLGTHWTPRVDGGLMVGPNALWSFQGREAYGANDFHWRDAWDAATLVGFWRLLFRHWDYGLTEIWRAINGREHLLQLKSYVNDFQSSDIDRNSWHGIRAQAVSEAGQLIDDFVIESSSLVTHVRNAPSPAATSSLALAEHICSLIN